METVAPVSLAASWDNVGLLIGSAAAEISGIFLGLDPTEQLLAEARACGANTIVTHHPVIFRPLKALRTEQPEGRFIAEALAAGMHIIGCHTNFDCTNSGVSDWMAKKLGLKGLLPLQDATTCPQDENRLCGLGRIGTYEPALSADLFLSRLKSALSAPWMLAAGPRPGSISRVAVCGGSGSELAQVAHAKGADVFVTGEVKHSHARWAESARLWLIDAGHFATENPAMELLAQKIRNHLTPLDSGVNVTLSREQISPLQIVT